MNRAAPQPRMARIRFHRQITRVLWFLPLPTLIAATALLWISPFSKSVRVLSTLILVGGTVLLARVLRDRLHYSIRTLSNIIAAMRDGDFSIRPHAPVTTEPLGALAAEINSLGDMLREQRLGALEASALLRTTIEEMDAAIFTFDDRQRLRLANRAAQQLLARPVEQLLGRTAEELGLVTCLEGDAARVVSMTFPGALGRFGIRRNGFRQDGRPHQLVVVTDLSRALRDEERQAWQRLVRVLGHELNNSLAPIKSVAASLELLCRRDPKPADWQDDVRDGLALISARAESLTRFMQAYAQLARLPAPRRAPMAVHEWIPRVIGLETRLPIEVLPGPEISLEADQDQLEQLLINLLRNAVDAVTERSEALTAAASNQDPSRSDEASLPGTDPDANRPAVVQVGWSTAGAELEVWVKDNGPGIANAANLFVPFFTTKPKGSGIGLSLCRQIAEAHGGRLTLENRADTQGCIARLSLPL